MSNTPDNLAATDAAILGRFQELQKEFGPAFLEEFRAVEREQLTLQGETWIDGQEPLSFDEFCIALDGCPLYPRQLDLFKRAGLLSPYSVIDPKRECREIVALWGKGCMSGDTLLTDRYHHVTKSMKEWSESGLPPCVLTTDGERIFETPASEVYCKGVEQLLLVTLADGRSFRATSFHMVLTPGGWCSVGDLVAGYGSLWTLEGFVQVDSVVPDHMEAFYDLTVAASGCYFDDQGILHHNSGKDYTIAKLISWICYVVLSLKGSPQQRFGLAPDARLYIVNVATNEYQAKTIFFDGYLKPFLRKAIFDRWRGELDMTEKGFEATFTAHRLILFSGHSRSQGLEGFNILAWVMDEADAFLDNEDKSNADQIHRIFRTSAVTRMRKVPPIGVVMSYTRTKDGFALRHHAKVKDNPLFACDLAATWDVRPDFDRNDPDVLWEYENNPSEARAMYECRPMETEGAWFEFSEKIDQAVDPSLYPVADCEYSYNPVEIRNGDVVEHVSVVVANLRPRPGRLYFLGGDGGKSGDSYALAVFHIDQSEEAALWLCPRCAGNSHFGGDPELGRTIRSMAHYEEFRARPADEDVLIEQARCGLCYVTPREALIHATVQWWWRNRDIAGKVAISRAGNTLHVPRIVEDLLIEVRPTRAIRQGEKDRTVDYLSVQEACRVLLTELPITSARFDPWNSTSIIQALRRDTGMDVDEIPFSSPEQYKRARLVKTLLYHNALALLPGAVDPYQKRLNEWKKLQLQGKGSVRRIDHPAGGSKDLYDAESVAIWQAANHACSGVEFLISKEA